MKKLLLLLLIPSLLFAGSLQDMHKAVARKSIASAGGVWYGSSAIDRAESPISGFTVIDYNESITTGGDVTSIKVYVSDAVTSVDFAVFTHDGGSLFSSGGSATGINLSAGLNTLNAPGDFTAFAASAGQYVGMWVPTGGGGLERDFDGALGGWYKNADKIPGSSITYTANTSYQLSLEFYVE